MHLSSVHTLILFAGLAYGQVDAVSSGIETDVPGDAYLLSISNFEASVSSYLVGAPSTNVEPVTDSNAGTESMKTGTLTSATSTGSMTATSSAPPSSEVMTLTTKTTATLVSGVSSSAPSMTTSSSSSVAGTSSETASAVTVSTTAGTASGSTAAARTEKTTSTTSASASPTGSAKNAADMVHGFAYGAGIVLLAVVLGGS